jgi:hypothetical protein
VEQVSEGEGGWGGNLTSTVRQVSMLAVGGGGVGLAANKFVLFSVSGSKLLYAGRADYNPDSGGGWGGGTSLLITFS